MPDDDGLVCTTVQIQLEYKWSAEDAALMDWRRIFVHGQRFLPDLSIRCVYAPNLESLPQPQSG